MKKIYLLFALLMGVCAFTACSDDDDDEKKNDEIVDTDKKDNEMVGTWKVLRDWYEDVDGNVVDECIPEELGTIIFEANGTCKEVYQEDGEEQELVCNYTYENKVLTLIFNENGEEKEIYNVTFEDDIAILKDTQPEDEQYGYLKLQKIK